MVYFWRVIFNKRNHKELHHKWTAQRYKVLAYESQNSSDLVNLHKENSRLAPHRFHHIWDFNSRYSQVFCVLT